MDKGLVEHFDEPAMNLCLYGLLCIFGIQYVRQIELLTIWLYSEWGEDRFVVVQHLWCRKISKDQIKITAMHSVCCYNLLGWRSFWNVPPSLMDWPGWQFLLTFRPEKHKLGRGRWELAFCQVSLNSVQKFQRKSRKCLSQSEDRTAILFFWSAWKTQAW